MIGAFTKKLAEIAFPREPRKPWGAINTYAKCERSVQRHLESIGIDSYLPVMTLYDRRGKKLRKVLQIPQYIFASWDCHDHPSLCTAKNKMQRERLHRLAQEDSVVTSMFYCRRLELISEYYPVEVRSGAAPGQETTLDSGELAGSRAFLSAEEGREFFCRPLDVEHYARILLSRGKTA